MPAESLPGIVSPFIASVFDTQATLLHELADGFGGPLHYLDPVAMERAIADYRVAAGDTPLQIAFAKKANKASAFVDVAIMQGIGIDVASLPELEHALQRGARTLSVSGGAKPYALLERAVSCGAMIVCDSDDELESVAAIAKAQSTRAQVLVRFRPESERQSRFGFAESNLPAIADIIERTHVDCMGIGFHCTGYELRNRVAATTSALAHLAMLRGKGLTQARIVDVGGGFTVRYRDHGSPSADARDFHAAKVREPSYPYSAESGPTMLGKLLAAIEPGDATLMIEPGRSLLDQAGFTAVRVTGVRERTGYGIVTVDATSFSLSESWFGSEFFVDPVVVSRAPQTTPHDWLGCIAGASCLESDMLAWRKIPFTVKPRVGDLLCFVNTAGYQMDSNESEFHGLPVPKKIILSPRPNGGVRWRLDGVRP